MLPIPTSLIYRLTTKYGECAVTGADGIKVLVDDLKIPKEKVKAIDLGVDLSKFTKTTSAEQMKLKKSLGIDEGEKVILLYGRLDKVKGHEYMLDSLQKLRNTNYKVIFPGENPEYKSHLLEIIKGYNLEGKIIFPGYVNGRDYLSIADLMVLPSMKDGISFAFLESITMGVPVIRTKTGDYYKTTKDLCHWVNYGDTDNLSRLIDKYLAGNVEFTQMAERAKNESHRFSIDNMVNEYYDLYCSILEKK